MDIRRRKFFRGKLTSPRGDVHLPWLISMSAFYDHCTQCSECAVSCPENIIVKGEGGYPALDFKLGECTFCQRCAFACPHALFKTETNTKPWNLVAKIEASCLTYQGVSCQSCQDSCSNDAIGFSFTIGKAAQPEVDNSLCTGCGACVAPCPVESITLGPQKK